VGAYTAFLDLALGIATPVLGLIAAGAGLNAVFLTSALVVLLSATIALRLLYAKGRVPATHDSTPARSDNGTRVPSRIDEVREAIAHETASADDRITFVDGIAIGSRTGDKHHDAIKATADV
jgi:hypothetical protein